MPDRPARWAYRHAVPVEDRRLALLRADQVRGCAEEHLVVARGFAFDA